MQRSRGCGCVRTSAADCGNAGIRLDHIALSADQEGLTLIGDQQQSLELAQHLIGAPVLSQLDRRTAQGCRDTAPASTQSGRISENASAVDPANPARILSW